MIPLPRATRNYGLPQALIRIAALGRPQNATCAANSETVFRTSLYGKPFYRFRRRAGSSEVQGTLVAAA